MTDKQVHNNPLIAKIVRLRIALLIALAFSIFCGVYYYSSESKQPFIGQPKELNKALLEQEIENASLLFRMDSIVSVNESLSLENDMAEGIYFEVQVASSDSFKLNKFDDNLKRLNYGSIDGVYYITLGKFRDVDDAKLFIDDLKKIGIRKALIVSKLDGKTVSVRE